MLLVSVVLPAYNAGEVIFQAIGSIIKQTFQDWELLIINDGSADSTEEIARKAAEADSRIHLYNLHAHMGLAKALNVGIALAQGEFIARQDSDDLSEPNRLALQLEVLQHNKDLDILGTAARVLISGGVGEIISVVENHKDITAKLLQSINPFVHGSIVGRRSSFQWPGSYDESYKYAQDLELWLRSLFAGATFANINVPLYNYTDLRRGDSPEYLQCIRRINSEYAKRKEEWLNRKI